MRDSFGSWGILFWENLAILCCGSFFGRILRFSVVDLFLGESCDSVVIFFGRILRFCYGSSLGESYDSTVSLF